MSTTLHGTAKKQQLKWLRDTLRNDYGPQAGYKPVPSSHQLDKPPYHASINTANALYDRIKNRRDFASLPVLDWQLAVPRIHCRHVDVELAIGFNRDGYLRVAKSFLAAHSDAEMLTAILRGLGRHMFRQASPGMKQLYQDWFNELRTARVTDIKSVRRHYARYFLLIYETLGYENSLRGHRAHSLLDQIVARERINHAGNPDLEPSRRMRNQVTGIVKRLLHVSS
jgi:hypothetical protein